MFALRTLQPDVGGLGSGRLELRLGLRDIRDRGAASLVEILRQLERLGVIRHGLVEQHLFGVFGAQREIIGGQLGMNRQIESREVGGARLLLAFAEATALRTRPQTSNS